jgi:1-acyl-sn-glycerol-3-phosphate acyltransferase
VTRVRRSARGHVGFWIRLAVVIIKPMVSLLFRVRWRGREQVPASGGVILAANHVSHADWLTFARYVWDSGRVPRFLAKESLFRVPGVGTVLRGARQIPVSRGTSAARQSLDQAVQALARGECVCIYPEGTTTKDPDFWPMVPRTGVARLALTTDAPVVPVAQWGPQLLLDLQRGRFRPFGRHELVTVAGPPVDLSAYRGRPVTVELLREVSDVIMADVRDLLAGIRRETPPGQLSPRPSAPGAS